MAIKNTTVLTPALDASSDNLNIMTGPPSLFKLKPVNSEPSALKSVSYYLKYPEYRPSILTVNRFHIRINADFTNRLFSTFCFLVSLLVALLCRYAQLRTLTAFQVLLHNGCKIFVFLIFDY